MSEDRSRLAAAMDDAHGTGLRLAGYNAAFLDRLRASIKRHSTLLARLAKS